jgi:hypothetical protein
MMAMLAPARTRMTTAAPRVSQAIGMIGWIQLGPIESGRAGDPGDLRPGS